jgi:sulfur-oxidizing protein SoxA
MKRALLCLLLVAAAPPLRSGHEDASPAVQAMQDDDTANPGMLWVQQGEALWNQAAGTSGQSCAGCHGGVASMRGLAARASRRGTRTAIRCIGWSGSPWARSIAGCATA